MDKNRKVKQQSFKYDNKNIKTKSNELIMVDHGRH